jgi:hypothetical protein
LNAPLRDRCRNLQVAEFVRLEIPEDSLPVGIRLSAMTCRLSRHRYRAFHNNAAAVSYFTSVLLQVLQHFGEHALAPLPIDGGWPAL